MKEEKGVKHQQTKKEQEIDVDKKLKRYEKLGAIKFQKVVFAVENIKYKVVKKICPNFIKYYEKWCDYLREKELKKNPEKGKQIIEKYRIQKLVTRKEWNRCQNRNYHMDKNQPTEFIKYLEWNKGIHKNGLVKNAILIPIWITGIAIGIPWVAPMLGLELFSTFINFECVNIQNYNICRFKKNEEKLKKIEERQFQRNKERYKQGVNVIANAMQETKEIPKIDDIIDKITTKEQLKQLKNMILEEKTVADQIVKEKRGRKHV